MPKRPIFTKLGPNWKEKKSLKGQFIVIKYQGPKKEEKVELTTQE